MSEPGLPAPAVARPALAVVGRGRLGTLLLALCRERGLAAIGLDSRRPEAWDGAIDAFGRDDPAGAGAGGVGVVVDCSAPEALREVCGFCERRSLALVECVSGLTAAHRDLLDKLACTNPVVRAANLSFGHYVQTRMLDTAAALVRAEAARPGGSLAEAVVFERHPATKQHSPSASAIALAERWHEQSGRPVRQTLSMRAGNPVSDHELYVSWEGQNLVVRHEVTGLGAAGAGALAAASWIRGRSPGTYPMHEVYDAITSPPVIEKEEP